MAARTLWITAFRHGRVYGGPLLWTSVGPVRDKPKAVPRAEAQRYIDEGRAVKAEPPEGAGKVADDDDD